jgi:hypothetical protein
MSELSRRRFLRASAALPAVAAPAFVMADDADTEILALSAQIDAIDSEQAENRVGREARIGPALHRMASRARRLRRGAWPGPAICKARPVGQPRIRPH